MKWTPEWLPSSLLCLVLSSLSSQVSAQYINITIQESPPQNGTLNVVYDNFLGISYELVAFGTLWGENVQNIPTAIQNYLSNLRARTTQPLRVRIGGNGMDGSTYRPELTDRVLVETDPNAYFNDIPVDFGPVMFDVMNAMYDRVGPMEFIIGLSMRTPSNDSNIVLLAKDAYARLGGRLDAMLLGNEPDLYENHGERREYNIPMYIPEIATVLDDLRAAGIPVDDKIIAGPTVCYAWELIDVLNAGLDKFPYKYYTLQHYPRNICGGADAKNTNISYYLDHTQLAEYVGWSQAGVIAGVAKGVPALLTEYNSVSCGGSNISDTFAMSIWAVDAALKAASMNFSGVYLHTREWGITYNLFQPPSNDASAGLHKDWVTGSPYYAALFIAEAISPTGSVVVDLNLNKSNTNAYSTVGAYGIWDKSGAERGKLVLINYADSTTTAGGGPPVNEEERRNPQVFRLPANITSQIQYRILTSPSVYEKMDISWAGQTVGSNGVLEGNQTTFTADCSGPSGCEVEVPSPGVALVILGSDAFYDGNAAFAFDNGVIPMATPGGREIILLVLLGLGMYLF